MEKYITTVLKVFSKTLYRASCNKYSAKLKSAKRLYYSELIDQCSGTE
jgi:hypothetical protein